MKEWGLLVAMACLGATSTGCAQSEKGSSRASGPLTESVETRAFAIPGDPTIRCSALPSDSVPPGAKVGYRFRIGDDFGNSRLITAGYDTAGAIVGLTEIGSATTGPTGATVDQLFAVFVNGVGRGAHTHRVQKPDPAGGDTAFSMRPLSPSQLAQAKALAAWLWGRKCP